MRPVSLYRLAMAGLMAVLCATRCMAVGTTLPYTDGFETYPAGALPVTGDWRTNGAGAVLVQTNTTLNGSKSLSISNASATLLIDNTVGTCTNVLWRFYSRPTMYDDGDGAYPPDVTNGSYAGIFYMTTNGGIRAFVGMGSSNWWTNASGSTYGPTNGWIGFEARINYASSNWDLYWATNGYNSTMTKVNGPSMPFITNNTTVKFTSVSVTNDCYIDSLFVGDYWAAGGVRLPFFDGFESYTLNAALPTNTGVWSSSGSSPVIMITNSPVAELLKSCSISSGNLVLPVDQGQGYTNVWCQFFCDSSPYDDEAGVSRPAVDSNSVAQFYIATNGALCAYVSYGTSNSWTNVVNVTTGATMGVALHLDYRARLWDLYLTSGSYGSTMHKANAMPMAMQTNAYAVLKLGDFTIQSAAVIDAFGMAVGTGTPSAGSPTNVAFQRFTANSTNMVGVLAHNYGSGIASTLAGALGYDLMTGLHDGDMVRLFYTNASQWNQYTLSDGAWTKSAANPAYLEPSNLVISAGMGMWVMSTGGSNGAIFRPYTTLPSITNVVYGTNDPVMLGWNMLGWPYPSSQNASAGWGFTPGAGTGDRMYIYENGGYVKLWWDNDNKRWRQGASLSSYTMNGGQAFWFYRAGTTMYWTVTSP